jgi:acetyltransferase-like isoleucine patch superfamily enzyme
VSGIRRISRPPFHARISQRRFLRWAAKETLSDHLGHIGAESVAYPPALIVGHRLIHIGDDVVIHPGSFLSVVDARTAERDEPRLTIGDGTRIGNDMVIACCGRVEIGNRVLTADRVYIGDTYHEYRDVTRPVLDQGLGEPRPVTIGDGSFLGVNSAVLPGVTLGAGAYVAANAVVTDDVPAHALVVGNPARVVRRWDGAAWVDVPGPASDCQKAPG